MPSSSDPPYIIIVDIDGTLSENTHRQRFLDKELYSGMTEDDRWEAFFSLCLLDTPKKATIEVVKAMFRRDYRIINLTGRPERFREPTRAWLNYHEIPFSGLYMRADDDRRPDHEVKEELFDRVLKGLNAYKSDVLMVLDDRDSVVAMWRRLGLTCFQVAPGDF